ncbi:epoxide hydrolase family protein [Kineococcus sp. GCM10028916]|uniref:epoxide hydrolase family protein n=1 Tax=Kineococcus sp. GCM10028916 TaxID=3273394 RepID=UPI00362CFADE
MSTSRKTPDARPLLAVPDAELEDLRSRLRATRWATAWPLPAWQAGTDGGELRRLVAHWADGYDWRAQEAALNALPSRFVEIDGTLVHHLLFEGERADALPVVLTNGWPSSFLEHTEFARRLTHPSEFGGDARDALTVVVPSLPGFAFSGQRPDLENSLPTHELWHRLMHDELGFERYGAHGSDLGAGVTGRLGQAHPEAVVGIHLLDVDSRHDEADGELDEDERAYLDGLAAWREAEGAYGHQHSTRPLTLAQGLSDSPSGLLAWILEKYRAWSDCDGDPAAKFGDDFLLTQASLYWFTNSISTSFRPYYESGNGFLPPLERVTVPTALALFPADLGAPPPRSWVEHRYRLTRYTQMPRGGHFAAREEPGLLAEDVLAFFRDTAG